MEDFTEQKAPFLRKSTKQYSELTFSEKLDIVKEIAYAAFPNILSSLTAGLKDVISLYFIGHLNNPLIFAALGFAVTWTSAFGTALIFGLAGGFGLIASQAYGASNYRKLGLLYQKSLVVASSILLAICLVLWFTRAELVMMGFEENLAAEIGDFIRCLLLDLFLFMGYEMTRYYLIAQNIFYIPALVLIISTILHIFWCHFFVNVLGMELTGIAIARTITDGTSLFLVYLYIRIKNPCPESWFPWTSECLDGIVAFAKDISSHGSSIYIEWVAFEITTIVIGFLGDVTVLAAHVASINYIFMNSTISLGLTLATCVFVGNSAGEGSLEKVQRYAYVGLTMNFSVVTCLNLVMLLFREHIALFYTEEANVARLIATILTFYFFGMHADLGCNMFGFLLRTLGQDRFVLKGFIFSYYGVGVTLSLITAGLFDFGFYGVWTSLLLGCYVMLALNTFRFLSLKWDEEVKKISLEMKRRSLNEERPAIELI